ncbi:MAG: YbaY family lipoprotein [Ferruginibacter sp.]|nr:YbaY family lipoprotein [Cytophagales bacterium]
MKKARAEEKTGPTVTGRIIIASGVPALTDATAHLRLEDISYADREAVLLAETLIQNVCHPPLTEGNRQEAVTVLAFELRVDAGAGIIDPSHEYAVRVWVDCNGDGKEGTGDLYSDQRYRVLTRGFGRAVTIVLDAH